MIRKLFRFIFWLCTGILLMGCFCFFQVRNQSEDFLSEDGVSLPACKAAVVLGTSPHLSNGTDNLYFSYRMEAASRLYKAGRVKYLILSGDNRVNEYNEPAAMRKALLAMGLPDSCLIADYAGLRTFDSMVRCRDIFGQDSVIVVSQRFHNERAVYIGRYLGMAAFGYNAKEVTTQKALKMKFREFFSRIKCVLDLYVLNTQPKHLGEKIPLK